MNGVLQCILVAALLFGGMMARAGTVVVFAAASLTDSLQEIARNYTNQSSDKIVLNFGASSSLARQIIEGAPADIFFSADEAKMDVLAKQGLIAAETRQNRLSNSLAIVVASDSALSISSARDLTNAAVKHIALADPKSVPAGIYAKEYLEKLGLWAAVEAKVVPVDNVRAALAAVDTGNVEVGIVYLTDAAIAKRTKVAYAVPPAEGPSIVYPVAMVKDSKDPATAKRFLDYLESSDAGIVFQKFGFVLPPPTPHER